jgi:WD40 repeat protein
VAFAPDSGALLTGGADGRLRVWDMAEGKELRNFGGTNGGAVRWVAWSPDGRAVASARSGGVTVWSAADGKKLAQWTNGAFAVAFAPDGARLAYAGDGGVYLVPVPARAAPRK